MKIEPQNEQRLVPAVIPEKTLATFIFIWNILADSVRDLKEQLPVNPGKSPNFDSKLFKDVKKIEKHFEDSEIIQLPIQLPTTTYTTTYTTTRGYKF